jgi:tetratricopeptide (TPR) repeat protein
MYLLTNFRIDSTSKFIFTISLFIAFLLDYQSIAQKKISADDTIQVNQLVKVATAYSVENPDMALHFGIKALELARMYDYQQGITDSWRILGKICQHMGQYELALDYQQQALDVYEQNNNQIDKAAVYNDMAVVLIQMKEFEQAMNYKLKALKIEDKIGNQEAIAQSYNQVGALYADLGNYELGLNFCLKSLDIRRKFNVPMQLADSYNVLGLVYMKSRAYQQALDYMEKALKLQKNLKDDKALCGLYSNLGEIHTKQGKHTEATSYYNQALHLAQEQGNRKAAIDNLMNLGKNHIELKQYTLSLQYLEEALDLSKSMNSNQQIEFCYGYLSEVYEQTGNFAEALKNYKLYTDYQKKIYDEGNSRKIAEMHDLIESERKDKEIMLLTKEKRIKDLENEKLKSGQYILLSFIGFLVIICILIILFARNKNLKASST